jgi:hypothetical protein
MVLLNFGFTNINVSKGKTTGKKVDVNTGLLISDVSISKSISSTDQKSFVISFEYKALYQPNAGSIILKGELVYLASNEVADQIQSEWKKRKALPKTMSINIYNRILHSCTVESLLLSREVGLPAPIRLPKLQSQKAMPDAKKAPAKTSTAKKSTPKK